MKKDVIGYVACCATHLQDGHEHTSKVFPTKEKALEWINRLAEYKYSRDTKTFQLFELGEEIALEPADIVEPQPPKVTQGYRLKGKK